MYALIEVNSVYEVNAVVEVYSGDRETKKILKEKVFLVVFRSNWSTWGICGMNKLMTNHS